MTRVIRWLSACLWLAGAPGFAAFAIGEPAPELSLPTLNGDEHVALTELEGQIVYVDFWASWCAPCRKSLPLYNDLFKRLSGQSFTIVAVNLDEDPEDGLKFLARHPVDYVVLSDPEGESAGHWGLLAMPSSFLVDRTGRLVKAYIGFEPSHMEMIERDIRELLETGE